jgi:hypothetical protein
MHRRRIGASLDQSATCSMTSSRVGSAQWMSSKTATRGRRSERTSKKRRTAPEEARELCRDALGLGRVAQRPVERLPSTLRRFVLGDPGRLDRHLRDRPERDPLPVGEAAAGDDDGGRRIDPRAELPDEAGLPDPRGAQDREQVA